MLLGIDTPTLIQINPNLQSQILEKMVKGSSKLFILTPKGLNVRTADKPVLVSVA
jgi:hypothetical protein